MSPDSGVLLVPQLLDMFGLFLPSQDYIFNNRLIAFLVQREGLRNLINGTIFDPIRHGRVWRRFAKLIWGRPNISVSDGWLARTDDTQRQKTRTIAKIMDAFQPRSVILLQGRLRKQVFDMYGMPGSTLNDGMKRAMELGIIMEIHIPGIYPQRAYRLRSPFIKSWNVRRTFDTTLNEDVVNVRLLNIDNSKDRKSLGLSAILGNPAGKMPRSLKR